MLYPTLESMGADAKEGSAMIRRLLVAGFAAAVIAGCGSGSATPSPASPSASAQSTDVPIAVAPGSTEAPTAAASVAAPATGTTMTTQCAATAVRGTPKAKGSLLVRVATGTQVHVVGTVKGDKYTAGTCGTSGTRWLKIDQIDGKAVQTTYGVPYGYSAAGFFK